MPSVDWAGLSPTSCCRRSIPTDCYVHLGTYRDSYACDVAFVGSNGVGYHEAAWPYRKELLQQLRAMSQRNGWSFRNPGGDDPKIDRGEDMNDFYRSARVTVGDSSLLAGEQNASLLGSSV